MIYHFLLLFSIWLFTANAFNVRSSSLLSVKRSSSWLLHSTNKPLGATELTVPNTKTGAVTFLSRGEHHVVVRKPPSVICHHSSWAGSRSKEKRGEEPEIPMLQRVRDAVNDIEGRDISNSTSSTKKVNLVHRLDRGASGALIFAFADENGNKMNDTDISSLLEDESIESVTDHEDGKNKTKREKGATAQLIDAMTSTSSTKTYVALVRGEGILRGDDLKTKGWFEVDRPIKDESGKLNNATTLFNFLSGQPEDEDDPIGHPRMSLVLARPRDGRWHQIRRHLNGLSHPILGDTSHGSSKVNREWKELRNMPGERTCLHLARVQLEPTAFTPDGIDTSCPLPADMLQMLRTYAPNILEEAKPMLQSEGILIEEPQEGYEEGKYIIPTGGFVKNEFTENDSDDNTVKVLLQGEDFAVVYKPPGVVCHHSAFSSGRRSESRRWTEPTPMLQRTRDAVGKRVNLVHRLDRSASGCLVFTYVEKGESEEEQTEDTSQTKEDNDNKNPGKTTTMIEAMQSKDATKTYIAFCHGDGIAHDHGEEDLTNRGWFTMDIPVKDEYGRLKENSITEFKFITGIPIPPSKEGEVENESNTTAAKQMRDCSKLTIVLARPKTGRWHQIRQQLASQSLGKLGLGPILGDSSHGFSRTNRMWRKHRNMLKERTCLHLARVQIPPTYFTPEGIDVSCPLPPDMVNMLEGLPDDDVLDQVHNKLADEGITGVFK